MSSALYSNSYNKTASETDSRTVYDWCAENRIDAYLLPLETRKTNPLETVSKITAFLEDMNDLQATFRVTEIPEATIHSGYSRNLKALFRLRRVSSSHCNKRFVNPNYTHLGHHEQPITSNAERLEFWREFQFSPTLSFDWVGANWGIEPKSVNTWLRTNVADHSAQLEANRRRMGRTLWTIYSWGDYSQRELVSCLPIANSTARTWMYRYGKNADDWEPPGYPSHEPWHKKAEGRND